MHGNYRDAPPPRTFPAVFPWFRLDRIYQRGFGVRSARGAARARLGQAVGPFTPAGGARTAVRPGPLRLHWSEGNAIRLLKNGAEFFPALCEAIDGAHTVVHLETYIFTLDRTAQKVLDALVAGLRARRQGARRHRRLWQLGMGGRDRRRLIDAGAQCRIFRPEPGWPQRLLFSRSRLRRLHRKVTVVDGRIAFVGGINIVDDYDDLDPTDGIDAHPRFDFAVEVRGPLVAHAVHAQDLLWIRPESRRAAPWEIRRGAPAACAGRISNRMGDAPGPLRAALVLRDNLRWRQTFERVPICTASIARSARS